MDLDNIIYIVATIVIFVVSLLGQKKKKVQAPVAEQEEEGIYTLNDFEKILERKQEYRQQEQAFEQEEDNKQEDIVEPLKSAAPMVEKKQNEDETENQDGFDVKSAIIYSSILERKKFRH